MICESITGTERHTYTIRTTTAEERVVVQFHTDGDSASATVGDDCRLYSGPTECVLAQPGVHTIGVELYNGRGQASYGLGVDSFATPSRCTTLDPATFSVRGPFLQGSLPRGSAGDCYRFDAPAGMRVDVQVVDSPVTAEQSSDVRGWMFDSAAQKVCTIGYDGGTCILETAGSHTFHLVDQYGGAVTYEFRLVRKDRPIGCGTLKEAAFGTLTEGEVASGEVPGYGFDCYTVVASAGLKRVQTSDGGQLYWRISNAGGDVCEEWGPPCDLAEAGAYTLWLNSRDWNAARYQATFLDLASDRGCEPTSGTGWDQPVGEVALSPVQALCQPFTAVAGERVIAYVSDGISWITDRTGARICDGQDSDQDGCVLPGSGPYRLVVLADSNDDGEREVWHQIRRLSNPAGCPVLTPGAYGAGPAGPLSRNRCRLLAVATAGRHLVRVVGDDIDEPWSLVYDAEGRRVCSAVGGFCDFPSAGNYTLVVGGIAGVFDYETATIFTSPRSTGCVAVSDQGLVTGAVRGSFATVGETDCLELPTAAGATVGIVLPTRVAGAARPDWTLINGAGEDLCETGTCTLTGPAPYRILLSAPEEFSPGDYTLVVQRLDRMDGCAVLPQGAMGDTVGATTAFSADRFATCWTIPADRHATSEIVGYAPVGGSNGWAGVTVRDSAGRTVCGTSVNASSQLLRCTFEAGRAYTVVLTAAARDFQYRITRKDSSPAGARCQSPTSTVLGGAAMAGTLRADDEVRCYRVTATAAEAFWLGLRSTGYAARFWITDASGVDRCSGYVVPCVVNGSTGYQMFVWPAVDGRAVPYRVDTWQLGAGGQPPPQCRAVAAAPHFGPLTGTLDEKTTGVCVAVPTGNTSGFTVTLTNTAGGLETPDPYYFHTIGDEARIRTCSISTGGRGCDVRLPTTQRSGTALFVLAARTENAKLPFRAEISCEDEPCPTTYALTSVTPAAVSNGGTATLTLRGSGLAATDTVTLTRAGAPSVPATVKSVHDGTMTVTVTVVGSLPGRWNVVARPADGSSPATLTGALTVTAAPLTVTRAPSVSGAVRVGSTVRAVVGGWSPAATSYLYQWTVNGSVIKGATGAAYVIPASMRGRRLAVTVTARRANRADTPAGTTRLAVGYGVAPRATTKPRILSTVAAGRTVRASVGAWSPRASSYRYEWRLNGTVLTGATAASVKVQRSWVGKSLTLVVIAKRTGHTDGRATSASIKVKK